VGVVSMPADSNRPRMFIVRWSNGWRWMGVLFGDTYDLGWVETMTVEDALRELFFWLPTLERCRVLRLMKPTRSMP
jgi:hypothetical protein